MLIKKLFLIIFINSLIIAYDNTNIIDATHHNLSQKVIATSKYIDDSLYCIFDNKNEKKSMKKKTDEIDRFYKNDKFIDETDDSFVRLRLQSNHQSLSESSFNFNLRAYLSLPKVKKNIKLFIEDVNKDNFKDLPFSTSDNEESAMAVGISYFTPSYYGIDSKYSIGMRGIYPYTKARYKKEFIYNNYSIEPIQSFIYSTKYKFKEETNLYIDKKLKNKDLFRIRLARSTNSEKSGMDYSLALQYFYLLKKDIGINFTQSFSGNTNYTYIKDEKTIEYKNINTYNTQISFRQSIWKKWFSYEIRPGIDFQKKNNFKINYKILFLTDFYFGNI